VGAGGGAAPADRAPCTLTSADAAASLHGLLQHVLVIDILILVTVIIIQLVDGLLVQAVVGIAVAIKPHQLLARREVVRAQPGIGVAVKLLRRRCRLAARLLWLCRESFLRRLVLSHVAQQLDATAMGTESGAARSRGPE
jgi:hypothetical protein